MIQAPPQHFEKLFFYVIAKLASAICRSAATIHFIPDLRRTWRLAIVRGVHEPNQRFRDVNPYCFFLFSYSSPSKVSVQHFFHHQKPGGGYTRRICRLHVRGSK